MAQAAAGEPARGRLDGLGASVNLVFRNAILAATGNRIVSRLVRRYGMRLGGSRFVAGETLDQAIPVLRRLEAQGLRTNTTILGEGVRDATVAERVTRQHLVVLDRLAAEGLRTNLALKLTNLGLDQSEERAFQNVLRIVRHAAERGNFIRIDMEESTRVDATLRTYRRLRAEGLDNVGTVLQSMLYRTPRDLEELLPLRPNLRLVKGAYLEPASVAYQRKSDVDRAYIELTERMLPNNRFTAIATHDERIIEHVIRFTGAHGIGPEQFEFQLLFGIRPALQLDLVSRGYGVRVATPFGREWYHYLMRRLAERPANVFFLLRNLVKG